MKHFEEHVEDISLILDEEECSDTKQTDMILDVNDRPPLLQWLFLSFQHVFAMFGATILGILHQLLSKPSYWPQQKAIVQKPDAISHDY